MTKAAVMMILVTLGAAASGESSGTPKAPAKATAPRTSAHPAVSDAKLEAAIRAKFAASKISADKFTVHVQGGVATIEGKTDVVQHKGTATRMAKTAGAAAVKNNVQVSDAAKQKAAGNLETGRRRAQIKRGDARTEQK
jgi:osmotically-inducible protein OsmY